MSNKTQLDVMAEEIVSGLVRKGIRLLALDFDKTIVDVHTAGVWRGGSAKLAEHVRPCFKALIEAAINRKEEIYVSVVTYSMQPALIDEVLKLAIPKVNSNNVIIRANSKDWLPVQGPGTPFLGKQQHIAWITTWLYNTKRLLIEPHEILLIDDDGENVTLARDFGHMAYEVQEEITMDNLKDFTSQMEVRKRDVTMPTS